MKPFKEIIDEEILLEELKDDYQIASNYPNPFNPSTKISYSLSNQSLVKVVIYDIIGREVKTLTSEIQTSGKHQVNWDGMNTNGVRISTGIYL